MNEPDQKDVALTTINIDEFFGATVFAGTTGKNDDPGDWGHGSRAVFGIKDDGGMGWFVEVEDKKGRKIALNSPSKVTLVFGGENEIGCVPSMLRWMADKIEKSHGRPCSNFRIVVPKKGEKIDWKQYDCVMNVERKRKATILAHGNGGYIEEVRS